MEVTSMVLIVGGVICVSMIAIYIAALIIAMNSIYRGSGTPISMAQTLLSSIQVTSQHLLGILIIILICILMIKNIVTSEAGLPLLSAVAGYLLAKTFKDIDISPRKKSKSENEEEKNEEKGSP